MRPVVLTRALGENQGLADLLAAHGVPSLEWPALRIEIVEPEGGAAAFAAALAEADAVGFVSPNAVRATVALLAPHGGLPRRPTVVAQGPGTARALSEAGLRPHALAAPPTAEGLILALLPIARLTGGAVVLPRGDRPLPTVVAGLTAAGVEVRTFTVYANRAPETLAYAPRPVRAAVFSSPSAVERLLGANPWLREVPAVAIGATTAAALRDAGHDQVIIPPAPTEEALCGALLAHTSQEDP